MAGVDVDGPAIARTLAERDSVWVRFDVDGDAPEEVAQAVDAVAGEGIEVEVLSLDPDGVPLAMLVPLGAADAVGWLGEVAGRLGAAGRSGTIAVARTASPPPWTPRKGAVPTAFVAWSTSAPGDPEQTGRWQVTADATERLVDAACHWGRAAGPDLLVGWEHLAAVTDPDRPGRIVGAELALRGRSSQLWSGAQPGVGRHATLTPIGTGLFQVVGVVDWAERIAALREVLTAAPDVVDLCFVRFARNTAPSWQHVDRYAPFPSATEADLRTHPRLLDRWVPDANGIQVLTDAHLARAADLSGWTITDLGHERHLVEAVDLAPWYGAERSDDGVVARARADFGAMILTPEVLAAAT